MTQQVTQPTQIIVRQTPEGPNKRQSPSIQIGASSPLVPSTKRPQSGLAQSIAPLGTVFRRPPGILRRPVSPQRKENHVIEISDGDDDSGPRYEGDSSDDEHQRRANIKPAIFKSEALEKFQKITSNAKYTLQGNDSERQPPSPYKIGASTPLPPALDPMIDIPIESISDINMRTKIRRMMEIATDRTVAQCRIALLSRKNNFSDAMDYLLAQGKASEPIDLTGDERIGDNGAKSVGKITKAPAKQTIKEPVRTIHAKWAAPIHPKPKARVSSPPSGSRVQTPEKPRRRLIQGRKHASPSNIGSKKPRSPSPVSSGSDSGFGDSSGEDPEQESRILNFFNSCSNTELVDIAAISISVADLIISRRRFTSLDHVRQVSEDKVSQKGRVNQSKRVGEKIVEKVENMFRGYTAVDALIQHCKEISKPLTAALTRWGLDAAKLQNDQGELDIVNMDSTRSTTDSGIGTPSSRSVSVERVERDSEKDVGNLDSPAHSKIAGQPSIMNATIALKDYQILGFNWIHLLYQKGLSGILADDMGKRFFSYFILWLSLSNASFHYIRLRWAENA